MIRKLLNGDIDRVADIWLKTNLLVYEIMPYQQPADVDNRINHGHDEYAL